MTEVIARIKVRGKNYETLVDVDKALKFKKGQGSADEAISIEEVFHDSKKGMRVPDKELEESFGTTDRKEIIKKIIKSGEIQVPKEHKDKEREDRRKQIIDFLSKYSIDPNTGNPHTPSRISSAMEQAGINIDNRAVEQQIPKIIESLKRVIPLKIQTKKLSLQIPAEHTGRVYGLLQEYKEGEEWLSNGDLKAIVNIPVGLLDDFYDKLNSVTHGSALSEEIKEKK